jgi:hypothetical protein
LILFGRGGNGNSRQFGVPIVELVSQLRLDYHSSATEIRDLARDTKPRPMTNLLRLAVDAAADLTPEANIALNFELSKRRLNQSVRMESFRGDELQRKEDLRRDPGRLWTFRGIGRKRLGKADYNCNSETGLEQFKTTVFVVIFWFPLIPTGTFRIERMRGWFSDRMTVLERLPLDWEQILKVWIVALECVFALIVAFNLLLRL